MKISFDFDNTLSEGWVQSMAMAFVDAGFDIWVTTSRRQSDSAEVYAVCDEIGIPRENCQFTHFEDKVKFLDGFNVHFDDDTYEIDLINRDKGKCKGVLLSYKNYTIREKICS